MFNTETEKNILVKSLRRTGQIDVVIQSLHGVVQTHSPFALYIATADRSSCSWIFDKPTVFDMLGGEDIHHKTFRSIYTTEEERDTGVIFYIFRKIGPIVAIRLTKDSINSVIESLKE